MKRSRIKTSLLAIACALSLGGLVGISSTFAAQEAETAHAGVHMESFDTAKMAIDGTTYLDWTWSTKYSGTNGVNDGTADGPYFTLNAGASFTLTYSNPSQDRLYSSSVPYMKLVSNADQNETLSGTVTFTCGTLSKSFNTNNGVVYVSNELFFQDGEMKESRDYNLPYDFQKKPFVLKFTNNGGKTARLGFGGFYTISSSTPVQVTFNKQGGTGGSDSVETDYRVDLPNITVPTREGYAFEGYYEKANGAGKQYYNDQGTALRQWDSMLDATLYAYWSATGRAVNITAGSGIKSVYIAETEDATSGSASGTVFLQGTTVYGFVELDKGYQHKDGWTLVSGTHDTEGAKYRVTDGDTIGDSVIELGTFNADLITYSITYDLGGGSVQTENPTTYNINTETFTLNNPVKWGYTFTGWLGDGMEDPSKTFTINKGSTGDKNIYAQWSTDIQLDFVTGAIQVWDGNPHTIGNLTFLEVSSGALLSDYEIRYSNDSGLSYELSQAPSFVDVGTYEIFYQVTKSGYTTLQGTVTLTIEKADSTFVTSPSAKTGLEFKNQDQELIVPGEVDYGDVLYAVNATGELPAEDQFITDIPTGNTVGTYYVFYKTTGDSNHNPIDADASNKLSVDIGRVSRASVEALSEEVDWFLNFAKDKSVIIDIASTLKGVKYEVTRDAIDEDNVVAEDVEANATKLQNAIDTAEISATKTLIDEIGELTYDGGKEDSLEDINVAKTIYDHLSETQKTKVDEANGSTLKRALEVYGHVDDVADLIKAIPSPSAEQEYYDAVAAAENAYSALTEEEKTLLSTSPDFNFKKSLDNELAVKAVIQTIEAIGELTYDGGRNDSLEDILAAKSAYNALRESEKAALDEASLSALNHALEVYGHVDHVADLIQAIPSPSASKGYYDAIDLAKTEYEKLTEEEKALLGECPDFDYAKSLDDHLAVKEVIQTIEAIGEVTYNKGQDDSKESIESAEEAYENLSEEQKQLVDQANYDKLAEDRDTYDSVEEAVQLIEAIGEVNHGGENDSEADIAAAREAYDQLSDEEKALVDGYNDSGKTLEDNEAVYEVLTVIDEIGEVGSSPDSEEKIKAAREAYDSLTDEQKAKLGDRAVAVLVNAEEEYANLQGGNNGWVIALLVVASLALLGGVIFLIVSIKKAMDGGSGNKPMKAMSIVPFFPIVILASRYLDAPFVALYIIGGLAVLIWIVNLVFVLLKKRNKVAKVSEEEKQEIAKTNAEPVTESVKETPLPEAEVALSSAEEPVEERKEAEPSKKTPESASFIKEEPSLEAKEEAKPNKEPESASSKNEVPSPKAKEETKPEEEEEEKESSSEPEIDIRTVKDEEGNIFQIRYLRSFEAKLIQAPVEAKKYYEELKNYVLSYKKANSRISWHYDAINVGRGKALKFAIRGKTLCVYLALDANDYAETKYKVEASESKKFEETPCLYRIKNDRRLGYCKDLIDAVMEKLGSLKGEEKHEAYADLPYEEDEPLIQRGLIKEQRILVKKAPAFEIRFVRSFLAKLSQSEAVTKDYYNELKNYALSYKNVHTRVSWHYDALNYGREQVIKFAIRGKTLCVYLALDAANYADTKYKVEPAEGKKYEETPCLYRIKNERRRNYCKDLIDAVMARFDVQKGKESNEDFRVPFENDESLLKKGLIKESKASE